jgi:L,D-transpeptidase ErfK/SrfK
MTALTETMTRLNQYNVDNVNLDYEQLSDVLSLSNGLITPLHPKQEQEPQRHSPEEKAINESGSGLASCIRSAGLNSQVQ